ncbi:5-formyltetrahydrofolate cyclo-ligase [Croceivirga radicis]|uniref:5-formyltetrahydrofolate cyclo-ligase n=1 Tax=Croceivirga radicis TaxID=1929488 RepID=A0A1V6LW39_9FLAO|nr:5-formyltetrahydrofolate cyclo-ligase [Croceivirga radicis]OQD44400.1 5-formyltetrahydrofolate cyclo-ligase [Croceivirga radicis]
MTKNELRVDYKKRRDLLNSTIIEEKSIQIANKVLLLPIWQFSFFHIFLPIQKQKEIDTSPLLSLLQGKDKHVVVPKMKNNQDLTHYLLLDNTIFKTNKWGIPEPQDGIPVDEEKLDVVFIPLLAYDIKGNRVGYGKGFYDCFLSKCKPGVLKVGLSFYEPEQFIDDVDATDIPLDYCITPEAIYKF